MATQTFLDMEHDTLGSSARLHAHSVYSISELRASDEPFLSNSDDAYPDILSNHDAVCHEPAEESSAMYTTFQESGRASTPTSLSCNTNEADVASASLEHNFEQDVVNCIFSSDPVTEVKSEHTSVPSTPSPPVTSPQQLPSTRVLPFPAVFTPQPQMRSPHVAYANQYSDPMATLASYMSPVYGAMFAQCAPFPMTSHSTCFLPPFVPPHHFASVMPAQRRPLKRTAVEARLPSNHFRSGSSPTKKAKPMPSTASTYTPINYNATYPGTWSSQWQGTTSSSVISPVINGSPIRSAPHMHVPTALMQPQVHYNTIDSNAAFVNEPQHQHRAELQVPQLQQQCNEVDFDNASDASHESATSVNEKSEAKSCNETSRTPSPTMSPSTDGNTNSNKKHKHFLPANSVSKLKNWFQEHIDHPYPTSDEKERLSKETGLTYLQVSNWFTNTRKRIWAPHHKNKQDDSKSSSRSNRSADTVEKTQFSQAMSVLSEANAAKRIPSVLIGPTASHMQKTAAALAAVSEKQQDNDDYMQVGLDRHESMLATSPSQFDNDEFLFPTRYNSSSHMNTQF